MYINISFALAKVSLDSNVALRLIFYNYILKKKKKKKKKILQCMHPPGVKELNVIFIL